MAFIRNVTFLVIFAGCFIATNAQTQTQEAPATTFRTSTELVTVPVVVTRGGKHLPGLTKDKFSVTEDGKPRTIASFEEINGAGKTVKRAAIPAGVYTNALIESPGPVGLTIILLDMMNTPVLAQANGRQSIIKFLSGSVQASQPTMLVLLTRSGMKVVHDFTTDTSVLVAALKKVNSTIEGEHISGAEIAAEEEMRGKNNIANQIDIAHQEDQDLTNFLDSPKASTREALTANQMDRSRATMELMGNLARAVRGIPGRKTLMWATGDIPCTAAYGSINMAEMAHLCEQTWNALSAADIAIYPIDLGQSNNPVYSSPQYGSAMTPRYTALQDLFVQSFAAYTGGVVCTFRNNLDTCFRNAVNDSEQYYLLSYYAQKASKPGWRKIRVKVNADHTEVRARNGYYTLGDTVDQEERRKMDMAWGSLSPVDYTGITMAAKWTQSSEKNGQYREAFELHVDSHALSIDADDKNHMKLNIAAVAHDSSEKIIGDVNQTIDAHLDAANVSKLMAGPLRYTNALDLPPGNYSVKFIVRDALSGRMGTVTAPLTVPSQPVNP